MYDTYLLYTNLLTYSLHGTVTFALQMVKSIQN